MPKVVVMGDFMVDEYVRVKTSRKAQEADIPVWEETGRFYRPGGADNVVENIKELGGSEFDVYRILGCSAGGPHRITKTRYVDENDRIIFRHDFDRPPFRDENFYASLSVLRANIFQVDALVVSDYDKGCVTPEMIALFSDIPIRIVDSKRKDLSMFRGFDILKLNQSEWNFQISTRYDDAVTPESMFKHVVVTEGDQGSTLYTYDSEISSKSKYVVHAEHFSTVSQPHPVDVTGCGDTHTAALTVALLGKKDIRDAVKYANQAASKKVMMLGTGAPT